jgi:hypothetical protein
MTHQPAYQTGMTFIGFILMLMLIGFFALLVLKIGPIYLEHFKIMTSLNSLKKDPAFGEKTKQDILSTLDKRWNIDMVDDVTTKDVVVTKQGDYVKVQLAYEVIEPIMGNVSVLVTFDDSVESGAH